MNEREIFAAALEQPTEADRRAFLDAVCDDTMRQRIERLLKERSQLGSFLEHPPLEADADALNGLEGTISSVRDKEDATYSGQSNAGPNPRNDAEIPLGYLAPATRDDSLGRLGHYEILEVVGKGAFGTVLRAFDEKLERVVAIKVLAPEMAATSPARKRFLREARTSAAVRHENVVAIYAVEDEPTPHLVMEFIPGKTLQQRLDEQGPLDLGDVLSLGKQIADGLAAAHAEGLIHRDIKPGNILLEGGMDERVKITDFGLARTADDASMTQSGVVAGTPMYMAPEQALGHKLDQRADLFSLGSVLYQMISGRAPFRAPTTMAVLMRVTEDAPRPIPEIIPEVPEWMCELIGHLHAKNPEERYGSAKEVGELLAQCAGDLQAGRVPEIPDPKKTTKGCVDVSPADVAEPVRLRRGESRLRSPLAKIAVAVVIMLGALGITEATGVTKVASTVIRIVTGEGTLVVEVDDPAVSITIEGEDVVITGAGPREVRLKPGEYKVRASRDGEPLTTELVTIKRGGRQVVRVTRVADGSGAGVAFELPTLQTKDPFVVLGGDGQVVDKFNSLASAVLGSSSGDTIEVRGNGPFVTDPLLLRHPLTIRAGAGFHPVIRRSPRNSPSQHSLLLTHDALALEGLEFQELDESPGEGNSDIKHYLVQSYVGAPLYICNCRFVTKHPGGICILSDAPKIVVANSEFIKSEWPALWRHKTPNGAEYLIDNCICSGGALISIKGPEKAVSVRLNRNTIVGYGPTVVTFKVNPKADASIAKTRVTASGNVFNTWNWVLSIAPDEVDEQISRDDAKALLHRVYAWRDHRNLFWNRRSPLVVLESGVGQRHTTLVEDLSEWKRLWDSSDDDVVEGRVLHHGGDLRARNLSNREQLTPEDFRLRPDSGGFRAGANRKDLGADIDLVGPGKAYERWRKTTEYQEWLKESAAAVSAPQ